MDDRLDRPTESRRFSRRRIRPTDRFGRISEGIARFLGTPRFIVYLTIFCVVWLAWNVFASGILQFDKPSNGFTALTLMLSIQASYAAPLILLSQSRQDDRDRVSAEQDRQRTERSLADTEYLAREVAALRNAVGETASRDFVRGEIRALLEELRAELPPDSENGGTTAP